MLIYSCITLQGGRCTTIPCGGPDTLRGYGTDPEFIARLLRKENSKALHILDMDGALSGNMCHFEVIRDIARCVDIPLQVAGGIRDKAVADRLLKDLHVTRLVLTTAALENQELLRSLLDEYGPRKIAVGLDLRDDSFATHGRTRTRRIDREEFLRTLGGMGVQRLLVTNLDAIERRQCLDPDFLIDAARISGCSVTVAGYIWGYRDLKRVQDLLPRKIDSVVLDEALYQDMFPCQRIWRAAELAAVETGGTA
jgi:phosphoribosylformimino-5-aminoimidazole carboxamide ribotide isomerase